MAPILRIPQRRFDGTSAAENAIRAKIGHPEPVNGKEI